jgi:hypothetical protein
LLIIGVQHRTFSPFASHGFYLTTTLFAVETDFSCLDVIFAFSEKMSGRNFGEVVE